MERYVDPNSGAAPQPGGFAGVEAAEKGFAVPDGYEVKTETSPAEYEAPGGDGGSKTVAELVEAAENNDNPTKERTEYQDQLVQALSNPKQVLADLDESGDTPDPESGNEEEASNDAALEHDGTNLNDAGDGDDEAGGDEGDGEAAAYDPSEYTVPEVNSYIEEHPDQKDAVLAAEKAGKNRSTLVGE